MPDNNPLKVLLPGSAMHDTFSLQPPRDITDGMPLGASPWTRPTGEILIPGDYQNNIACAERILAEASGGYYVWPRLRPRWRQAATDLTQQAVSTGTMFALKNLLAPPESGLMELPPGHAYTTAHKAVESFVRPLLETSFSDVSREDVPLLIRGALDILRREFEKIRSDIPAELAQATEKSIDDLQRTVENFKPGQHSYFDPATLYADFRKIFYHLSFPVTSIDLLQRTKNGDEVRAEELDRAHKELSSSFPESVQDSLDEFIRTMRFNSVVQPDPKPITVFAGPPATGKTHLVKALAERFSVPILIVNAAELSELLSIPNMQRGPGMFYGMSSDFLSTLTPTQRKLLQDIQSAPIVCLDEMDPDAHPELWNGLKAWSSGKPAELNGKLGVNVLPESTTLIVTTNKVAEMEAVLDPQDGVKRRTTFIKFPPWSHDKLRVRANEHLDSYLEQCGKVFKEETIRDVKPLAQEVLDFELKELEKYEPGMLNLGELQKRIASTVAVLIMDATAPMQGVPAPEDTAERLAAVAERLKKQAATEFAAMHARPQVPAQARPGQPRPVFPEKTSAPLQSSAPPSGNVQFPGKGQVLGSDARTFNALDSGQGFLDGMAARFGPVPYPPGIPPQEPQSEQQISPTAKRIIGGIANLTPEEIFHQYRPRVVSDPQELSEAPRGVLVKIGNDGTLYFQSVLHREPRLTAVAGSEVPPSLTLTVGQPLSLADRKIWELTQTKKFKGPEHLRPAESVALQVASMSPDQIRQEFDITRINTAEDLQSAVQAGSKLVRANDGSLYLYDDSPTEHRNALQEIPRGAVPSSTLRHLELCAPLPSELTRSRSDRENTPPPPRHRRR